MSQHAPANPHRKSRRRRRRSRETGVSLATASGPAATQTGPRAKPAKPAGVRGDHEGTPKTPRFLSAQGTVPSAAPASTPGSAPVAGPGRADTDSAAEREARADGPKRADHAPEATPFGREVAKAMGRDATAGTPLDAASRAAAEADLGPLGPVTVHRGSALAAKIGANAVTYSGAIHLAPDAPAPHSAEGRALIAHELTHVAQQNRFGAHAAQFDMDDHLDSGLGAWHIRSSELTRGTKTGMNTFIDFDPDAASPYSTRIGLVQTLAISRNDGTDRAAAETGTPSDDVAYNIRGFDPDRTRDHLSTDNEDGTEEGFHVDVTNDTREEHEDAPAESEPWYLTSRGAGRHDQFGWNRGGGDTEVAKLGDYPGSSGNRFFDFEVAAIGRDNRTIYGYMQWGFSVISGTVPDTTEYARAVDVTTAADPTSANYDEALQKWRDFYTHEPVAIYFDTDSATPQSGQTARLADIPDWMTTNADAQIVLLAHADHRGSAEYNQRLARRRAAAVRALLIEQGVPEGRITEEPVALGETTAFGSEAADDIDTAGNLQANRRVEIQFRRDMAAGSGAGGSGAAADTDQGP